MNTPSLTIKSKISKKTKLKQYTKGDGNLYMRNLVTRKISIHFKFVGANIKEILEKVITEKVEGKCSVEGYIKKGSSRIITYSSGEIKGNLLFFQVVFECLVCNPVAGMRVNCVVKNVSQAGLRALAITDDDNSPLIIYIARDHHYMLPYFGKIKEDETINVRIIGQTFELNDKFISVIGKLEELEEHEYDNFESKVKSLKEKGEKTTVGELDLEGKEELMEEELEEEQKIIMRDDIENIPTLEGFMRVIGGKKGVTIMEEGKKLEGDENIVYENLETGEVYKNRPLKRGILKFYDNYLGENVYSMDVAVIDEKTNKEVGIASNYFNGNKITIQNPIFNNPDTYSVVKIGLDEDIEGELRKEVKGKEVGKEEGKEEEEGEEISEEEREFLEFRKKFEIQENMKKQKKMEEIGRELRFSERDKPLDVNYYKLISK